MTARRAGAPRTLIARLAAVAPPTIVATIAALLAACSAPVTGTATTAPFSLSPLAELRAQAVGDPPQLGGRSLLGFSPDGQRWAGADRAGVVCVFSRRSAQPAACLRTAVAASRVSAAFSPDGQSLAVTGSDVQTPGEVWLLDLSSGGGQPVPAAAGAQAPRAPRSVSATTDIPGADPPPAGPGWMELAWDHSTGHLILLSRSGSAAGPVTRAVDYDPATRISRLAAPIGDPTQGVDRGLVAGGGLAMAGVFSPNEFRPDLQVITVRTGTSRNLGKIPPSSTSPVPLAISPDGRLAAVGSASLGVLGAPRVLDLRTGIVRPIPCPAAATAAAFSLDGRSLAVLDDGRSGTASVWVCPVDGSVAARTLIRLRGSVPRSARLTWSPVGVVAITGSGSGLTVPDAAWRIR